MYRTNATLNGRTRKIHLNQNICIFVKLLTISYFSVGKSTIPLFLTVDCNQKKTIQRILWLQNLPRFVLYLEMCELISCPANELLTSIFQNLVRVDNIFSRK